MKRTFAACALALAMMWPSASALAWNHKGHMTVALIAWQQLNSQEQTKVFNLLKSHPDFQMLANQTGLRQTDRNFPMMLFVEAARWPDLIREDPRFFDENNRTERPTPPLPGFPDMKKHKPWHFKDIGFRDDGSAAALPNDGGQNAQAKIHEFEGRIGASGESAAHRAYFLAWLEHLVGDVHQPLHCAARVTRDLPKGDRGGNLFDIAPFRIPEVNFDITNLHSLWDNALGDDMGLADIQTLARRVEASSPGPGDSDLNEANWISESFNAAKTIVYAPLTRPRMSPPARVSQTYFNNAQALALQRMRLAGHRLAAVIKKNLR